MDSQCVLGLVCVGEVTSSAEALGGMDLPGTSRALNLYGTREREREWESEREWGRHQNYEQHTPVTVLRVMLVPKLNACKECASTCVYIENLIHNQYSAQILQLDPLIAWLPHSLSLPPLLQTPPPHLVCLALSPCYWPAQLVASQLRIYPAARWPFHTHVLYEGGGCPESVVCVCVGVVWACVCRWCTVETQTTCTVLRTL